MHKISVPSKQFQRLLKASEAILGVSTLALALIGCGSSNSTLFTAAPPQATAPRVDDWTTYAHDQQHTGLEVQALGVSKTSVSNIKLRWTFTASDQVYASPVVTGGLVIICTANTGVVYALSVKTGAVVWQRALGGQIRATPTIADGQIFVGTHLFTITPSGGFNPAPSSLYSLDLVSGAVRWATPLSVMVRGSAIALGGRIIVGLAGGDGPTCFTGGVLGLDETSGAVDWFWAVNPILAGGGAVWAPIATDGTRIIVGTGNSCSTPVSTSNSTVALDPATGRLEWAALQQKDSAIDDDTGGGALILNSEAYDINKDGKFYGFDRASGQIVLSESLNPIDGAGGYATPTSDGSTIVIGGGSYGGGITSNSGNRQFFTVRSSKGRVSDDASSSFGKIFALGLGGAIKWSAPLNAPLYSYAAIASGMVFVNNDNSVEALDLTTGAKLWSYALDDQADGGVAIVPSGLYTASNSGTVYAFTL